MGAYRGCKWVHLHGASLWNWKMLTLRAVSIKMHIKLLIVPPALEMASTEPDSIDISTASHSSQLQNYTTAKIAIMCAPSPRLTKTRLLFTVLEKCGV